MTDGGADSRISMLGIMAQIVEVVTRRWSPEVAVPSVIGPAGVSVDDRRVIITTVWKYGCC